MNRVARQHAQHLTSQQHRTNDQENSIDPVKTNSQDSANADLSKDTHTHVTQTQSTDSQVPPDSPQENEVTPDQGC